MTTKRQKSYKIAKHADNTRLYEDTDFVDPRDDKYFSIRSYEKRIRWFATQMQRGVEASKAREAPSRNKRIM